MTEFHCDGSSFNPKRTPATTLRPTFLKLTRVFFFFGGGGVGMIRLGDKNDSERTSKSFQNSNGLDSQSSHDYLTFVFREG